MPSSTCDKLVLEYEMLKEQQFWFSQFADVNVTSTAPTCSATYALAFSLIIRRPRQSTLFPYTTLFRSDQTWPAAGSTRVRLGVHFADAAGGYANVAGWRTDQRFDLQIGRAHV